jgi:hypothetical protein
MAVGWTAGGLVIDAEIALALLKTLPVDSLANRVLALSQRGLCGTLEIACRATGPELKQFFECGQAVTCGRRRIVSESDALQGRT